MRTSLKRKIIIFFFDFSLLPNKNEERLVGNSRLGLPTKKDMGERCNNKKWDFFIQRGAASTLISTAQFTLQLLCWLLLYYRKKDVHLV